MHKPQSFPAVPPRSHVTAGGKPVPTAAWRTPSRRPRVCASGELALAKPCVRREFRVNFPPPPGLPSSRTQNRRWECTDMQPRGPTRGAAVATGRPQLGAGMGVQACGATQGCGCKVCRPGRPVGAPCMPTAPSQCSCRSRSMRENKQVIYLCFSHLLYLIQLSGYYHFNSNYPVIMTVMRNQF